MARAILNSAISRARGRIGDVVFRGFKGTTVMQKVLQRHQPWSKRQRQYRHTFKTYTAYAARVRSDAELRKVYTDVANKRNCRLNYWQVAIRDHANPPVLSNFQTHRYGPSTGGLVSVVATDDFEVTRVHFAVRDANGGVLHLGDATYEAPRWNYTVPPPLGGQAPAASVVVTAFDRPGNFAIGAYSLT